MTAGVVRGLDAEALEDAPGAAAFAMPGSLADLAGKDPAPFIPGQPAEFFNLVGLVEWSEIGERHRVTEEV